MGSGAPVRPGYGGGRARSKVPYICSEFLRAFRILSLFGLFRRGFVEIISRRVSCRRGEESEHQTDHVQPIGSLLLTHLILIDFKAKFGEV